VSCRCNLLDKVLARGDKYGKGVYVGVSRGAVCVCVTEEEQCVCVYKIGQNNQPRDTCIVENRCQ
jgi:hypothetical protein